MTKSNVFTAVFRDITTDEAGEIVNHPKWSAGSWSHALDSRNEAVAALEAANARLISLESERDALLAAAGKEAVAAVTTNGKPASQYFRAGRGQGLQEAMLACKREHLEEPAATADDIAYTAAVDDCIKAISRLIGTAPTAALENGDGRDAEDARRYRWIRDVLRLDDVRWMNIANWNQANISAEVWDQEIDAALSQKAGEQQ